MSPCMALFLRDKIIDTLTSLGERLYVQVKMPAFLPSTEAWSFLSGSLPGRLRNYFPNHKLWVLSLESCPSTRAETLSSPATSPWKKSIKINLAKERKKLATQGHNHFYSQNCLLIHWKLFQCFAVVFDFITSNKPCFEGWKAYC